VSIHARERKRKFRPIGEIALRIAERARRSLSKRPTGLPSARQMSEGAMKLAEPIEIGKFFSNRCGEFVVVAIREFEGVIFVDARKFYTGADGISRPTKKGLAVTLRKLPELVELLEKTLAKARELGLIGGEGEL
jgi:hypothetical protein